MRYVILIVSLIIGACTTTDPIPLDTACHEQADAWCKRAGFGVSPGCTSWYVHECEPGGPNGAIDPGAQNACMDAIADNPEPGIEPVACQKTWGGT